MVLSYEQIVKHIEAQRDLPAREGSFERFKSALSRLAAERNLVFNREQTIVIAGTNGKGSTAKSLQTLLTASGQRTGLFTSPHLIESTERIRINGEPISRDEFVGAYAVVEKIAQDFTLGHFEIVTLMAAEVFYSSAKTGWTIFEVGVGGELDPTRLMPHATSLITPLGFDHEKILGSTMPEIAKAKLGIVDEGNLVVHAPWAPGAEIVAAKTKARCRGRWLEATVYPFTVDSSGEEPRWVVETPWGVVTTDLIGERGVENLSLALQTFVELGFDPAPVVSALTHVQWPGRMEAFDVPGFKTKIYLSGDHNPQGIQSLHELLVHYTGDLHFIVGITDGKEAAPMLEALVRLSRAKIYLTQTPFRPRPLEVGYGDWFRRAEFAHVDPMVVLRRAQEAAGRGDRLIVTGSLYLVGEMRKQLLSIGGRPCQDQSR